MPAIELRLRLRELHIEHMLAGHEGVAVDNTSMADLDYHLRSRLAPPERRARKATEGAPRSPESSDAGPRDGRLHPARTTKEEGLEPSPGPQS